MRLWEHIRHVDDVAKRLGDDMRVVSLPGVFGVWWSVEWVGKRNAAGVFRGPKE